MAKVDPTRRRLVTGLAAAAATAATMPATAQPPRGPVHGAPAGRPFGIAIVGLGGYGRYAIERLATARLARPAGIITGSPERARETATRYGIPPDAVFGYDEYARLADDDRIDAVHVCLPVGLHAAHARLALAAGKHVLVEKPMASTLAEAEALVEAAAGADRILMPAYRAWFSNALQEACRRARDGEHGALRSIDAHKGFAMTLPEGNWRFDPALSGGGCLVDIGIYSVQLQRWIAGGLPLRVTAMVHHAAGDARFAKVESDISWLAEFAGGVLATGSASWTYRFQNRARIGFTNAWLDLDPATPAIGERLRLGRDEPSRVEELMLPLREQVPLMYDAFAEACRGRAPLPVSPAEGVSDLRVIEALMRSVQAGGPVEV